jgi:hypothetical protein
MLSPPPIKPQKRKHGLTDLTKLGSKAAAHYHSKSNGRFEVQLLKNANRKHGNQPFLLFWHGEKEN